MTSNDSTIIQKQNKYSHLNAYKRGKIQALRAEGFTLKAIAERIGCHESTVSRELKRGETDQLLNKNGYTKVVTTYFAETGEAVYQKNRENCRFYKSDRFPSTFFVALCITLKEKPRVHSVTTFLKVYKDYHPDHVIPCVKTVYRYIREGLLDIMPIDLPKMVRHRAKPKKMLARTRRKVLGRSIEERPKEVETRQTFGHWEIDLVLGKKTKGSPVLLTIVERKTRYYIVKKLKNRQSATVLKAIKQIMKTLGFKKFKSITADNGSEFSRLHELENQNRKIYFAHPYAAFERGTNEIHNGMLREYIPKGTDISTLTSQSIQTYVDAMNDRPRKVLDFLTPEQMYSHECSILV